MNNNQYILSCIGMVASFYFIIKNMYDWNIWYNIQNNISLVIYTLSILFMGYYLGEHLEANKKQRK
jgi:hypothetical protein